MKPLGRMLLLSAGLHEASFRRVHGRAASSQEPATGDAELSAPIPSQWQVAAFDEFGEIRRTLDTPIINSIWRSLAQDGLLTEAWAQLVDRVEPSRTVSKALQDEAISAAQAFPWPVVADPEALERAGIPDALPAIRVILDAYITTLAGVLALVAPSQGETG